MTREPPPPGTDRARDGATVVVWVEESINPTLAGRRGCTYRSPPQSLEQALALVRLLLGSPGVPIDGRYRWSCPVAGGQRTVTIESATARSAQQRGSRS